MLNEKNEICKNDINKIIDNFSMLYNDVMYIKKIINIYFENNIEHDKIELYFHKHDDIYMIAYYKNEKIVNNIIFDFDFETYSLFDEISKCKSLNDVIEKYFDKLN